MLNHTDLIGIVFVGAVVDRVCLELSDHSITHFTKVEVSHVTAKTFHKT